jgi:hypothetical protein
LIKRKQTKKLINRNVKGKKKDRRSRGINEENKVYDEMKYVIMYGVIIIMKR